jgi:hypothetical protein
MRARCGSLLRLAPAILALLAALAFATNAYADSPVAVEDPPATTEQAPPPSAGQPEQAPLEPESVGQAGGEAPAGSPGGSEPEEVRQPTGSAEGGESAPAPPPAEETPPPAPSPPEATEPTPPPEATEPTPPPEATEPAPTPPPAPEEAPPPPVAETPIAPLVPPPGEPSSTVPAIPVAEKASKGNALAASTQDAETSTVAAAEPAPEFPSGVIGSMTPPGPGSTNESSPVAGKGDGDGVSGMVAAQAGPLSCALSELVGRASGCDAAWMGAQRLLSASSIELVATSSSSLPAPTIAAVSGAPGDDGHDGTAGGGHPTGPAPAPAPGGAAGGSAVGGSGLALSAFLTLAGLLGLAAPRAMRRLRLSCQPWLTACFALIPERPG